MTLYNHYFGILTHKFWEKTCHIWMNFKDPFKKLFRLFIWYVYDVPILIPFLMVYNWNMKSLDVFMKISRHFLFVNFIFPIAIIFKFINRRHFCLLHNMPPFFFFIIICTMPEDLLLLLIIFRDCHFLELFHVVISNVKQKLFYCITFDKIAMFYWPIIDI